jgi:hypothetical protein
MKARIEELNPLSKSEKLALRFKNFLKIRLTAYGIGAATAFGAGSATQSLERDVTGYDPKTHAELKAAKEVTKVDDFEKFKEEKKVEEKKSLLSWAKGIVDKVKSVAENPEAYIKGHDMYKEVQLKYMKMLEFIDDAAFIAPALLTFIMLGGFLSRKLDSLQGNTIDKEEKKMIRSKINELVEASNQMLSIINQKGIGSLSQEELNGVKELLNKTKDALPDPSEIEGDGN